MIEATTESGEDLLGKAQNETPVDTGTLRASGTVDITTGGMSCKATVTFGGGAADYAIYQHEGTSRGVPATKFLERPLIEHAPVYQAAMAAAARGQF